MIFLFENYSLDSTKLELRYNSELQKIEPQVFALLSLLVENNNQTVSKEAINERVWKGRIVSDAALNSRIRSVRLAIGDNGTDQRLVKTIPNVGLRFIGNVTVDNIEDKPASGMAPFKKYLKVGSLAVVGLMLIALTGFAFYKPASSPSSIEFDESAAVTDAHQAYQRGISLKGQNTPRALELAEAEFKRTIELDPNFGAAYAAIAEIYQLKYYAQHLPIAEAQQHMESNIAKALSISPKSAKVLEVAATVSLFDRRYEEALIYADKAINVAPGNAQAHNRRAFALDYLGRSEEAMAAFKKAVSIEPLSATYLTHLANAQIAAGNLADAFETASNNLKWNPDDVAALTMMSNLRWNDGDYAGAHRLLTKANTINPEEKIIIADLLWLYSNIGLDELSPALIKSNDDRALYSALAGNNEEAKNLTEPGEYGFGAEFLPYLSGNLDLAAEVMRDELNAFKFTKNQPVNPGDGSWFAQTCFVFRAINDKQADPVCNKLGETYLGKKPEDFNRLFDHLGGLGFHIINNDMESAMIWLDHMVDNDHAFLNLTVEPIYAPLDGNAEYASRLTQMEKNAQKHRTEILAQLEE